MDKTSDLGAIPKLIGARVQLGQVVWLFLEQEAIRTRVVAVGSIDENGKPVQTIGLSRAEQ